MFISRPDAELFSVSFGLAPRSLLALGGWVGSWELWLEPFQTLSLTWRTVAYDHRGSGASFAETQTITFERMVEDVVAVADAYGLDRCVLAAESAGVAVAFQAALRYPDRFDGIVSVAGLYARNGSSSPDPFLTSLENDYEATLDAFVKACVPELNGENVRRWGRQIVGRSQKADAIRLYESLKGVDLRPEIPGIRQKTLVVHGTSDHIQPIEASYWLAAHLPKSELRVLDGAGHVPTMTRAAEVASAINGFFAE